MSKHDKAQDKTNAMRMFDAAGLPHEVLFYDAEAAVSGAEVAAALGQDPVTVGKSGEHYVFMVPVEGELNLKKAASAAGEKSIAMIKSRELLPLTGYIHGGCSPLGMKKVFPTFIDETAILFDTIMYSGGRRGCQICSSLADLQKLVDVQTVDITA